jgi:hypothetical protein
MINNMNPPVKISLRKTMDVVSVMNNIMDEVASRGEDWTQERTRNCGGCCYGK